MKPYRSPLLEAVAADPPALARAVAATGMKPRHVTGLADEELRLLEVVGGGERYASLRAFLEAVKECSRTG